MQVLEEQKIIDYEFIIILFKLLQVKNGFIELDESKPGLSIELSQKYLNEFDIEI